MYRIRLDQSTFMILILLVGKISKIAYFLLGGQVGITFLIL